MEMEMQRGEYSLLIRENLYKSAQSTYQPMMSAKN